MILLLRLERRTNIFGDLDSEEQNEFAQQGEESRKKGFTDVNETNNYGSLD